MSKMTLTKVQVLEEVEAARQNVRILMAHGDGEMKRRMNLMGKYPNARDAAAKAVIDNAFLLAMATEALNGGVLSFFARRRFLKRVALMNKALEGVYGRQD
jgi:hypothetical protein